MAITIVGRKNGIITRHKKRNVKFFFFFMVFLFLFLYVLMQISFLFLRK